MNAQHATAARVRHEKHLRLLLTAAPILAVFLADYASKTYLLMLEDTANYFPLALCPVLTITLVWNHGISYGLLQANTGVLHILLLAGIILAIVVLGRMIVLTKDKTTLVLLSMVFGGALGNLYDRVTYGAVLDFIDLHIGDYHWYVFNLADCAIVLGGLALFLRFQTGAAKNLT